MQEPRVPMQELRVSMQERRVLMQEPPVAVVYGINIRSEAAYGLDRSSLQLRPHNVTDVFFLYEAQVLNK